MLELRLGARFGNGTGERDRERVLEEAAVVAAARGSHHGSLVAGQLPKGRGRRNRWRCSGCGGCVRASGGASAAQDPGDADRNGVLELGKRGELGCKPAQVITARHGATKSTAKGTKEGEAALTKRETDAVRQGAPGPSPWARQSGKPPGAAMSGAQEGQDSQSQENGLRPERAKKTQERAHEKQKPESQVEGKKPARARCPCPR